jgi:hypothetical protein
MFQPVHGTAPAIAGKGLANPLATMLAGAMMIEHMGETAAAQAVENAVRQTLAAGQTLTTWAGRQPRWKFAKPSANNYQWSDSHATNFETNLLRCAVAGVLCFGSGLRAKARQ